MKIQIGPRGFNLGLKKKGRPTSNLGLVREVSPAAAGALGTLLPRQFKEPDTDAEHEEARQFGDDHRAKLAKAREERARDDGDQPPLDDRAT